MPTVTQTAPKDLVKFRMHLAEVAEYVRQLEFTEDTELAEAFSAACWDVMFDQQMMIKENRRIAAARAADRAWQRPRRPPAAVRTVKTPKLPGGDRTEEAEAARWSARIDAEPMFG